MPVLERLFGFRVFDADVYYITQVPSELHAPRCAAGRRRALLVTLRCHDLSGAARGGDVAGRSAALRVSAWRCATAMNGCSARATCAPGSGAASCRSSRIVSMLGLALGVAVLIVVLSVMNGFERELRSAHPERDIARHADGPGGPLPDWRGAQRAGAGACRA